MEALLERHFAGQTLREAAEAQGVSHQTILTRLRDIKRQHVTEIAMDLLIATRTGEELWLLVPTTSGTEIATWLRYLAWMVDELESLTFRVQVTVQQKVDGIAFGLTDMSRGG